MKEEETKTKKITISIPTILILVLGVIILSIGTSYAAVTIFNSSDVNYDNTSSGIRSTNVQGAIDELYACASNYSAYDTRLSGAETNITSLSNQITSDLQVLQSIIRQAVAENITTVASLDTVLPKPGNYFIETSQTIRTTLMSIGLIPVNVPGIYEVRKITNGYYFINFTTYTGKRYFTSVDVGTVKTWMQITTNDQIGDDYFTHVYLYSTESTTIKRLHSKWSTFVNDIKTAHGLNGRTDIIAVRGIIDFPPYEGSTNLGTNYYWGTINLANNQGTIFFTHYHSKDAIYVYKNHSSTADGEILNTTSVDIN